MRSHGTSEYLPRFGKATFGDSAYFESAIFGDSASFDSITFGDRAFLNGANFGDRAFLNGANFGDRASFLSATFGDAAVLRVSGSNFITFGRLKMGRGGVIRATCSLLDMFGATFPYGVTLLAREADVAINQVSFGEASIMAAFGPSKRADEPDMPGFTGPRLPWAPRLLSMQGCDVTYLTLNAMDLRPCWFQGAYNLELLRIGGGAVFAQQPPARLWTRRLVLAEEHVWRAIYEPRRRSRGWYPNECRGREGSTPSRQPKERRSSTARTAAGTVELVYRALRKGLEDVKDEPGAADFYYGEMEMRRRAAPPRSVERALLFVYWLLAGYGLRASRALAALLVVLALTTVGFVAVGFASSTTTAYQQVIGPSGTTSYRPVEIRGAPPGWTEAVTYSVQSTTSLLSAPTDEPLTERAVASSR